MTLMQMDAMHVDRWPDVRALVKSMGFTVLKGSGFRTVDTWEFTFEQDLTPQQRSQWELGIVAIQSIVRWKAV